MPGIRGVSVAGFYLAHRVIKRSGETPLFYVIPLVFAVATAGLGAARSPATLPLLLAVMFIGAVKTPLVTGNLNKLVGSQIRATILSTAALGYTLMVAVTQPVLGWVADRWGVSVMRGTLGAGFALLSLPLLAAWRPRRQSVSAPTSPVLPAAAAEPEG